MSSIITQLPKQITTAEAIKRLMDIEEALHALIHDCDISGFARASNELDHIVSYCIDHGYAALGKAEG